MPPLKDLKGNRYSRLVVIARAANSKSNQVQWVCRCDCGSKVVVRAASLLNGHTMSCGCYCNEIRAINTDQTTHGGTHTRLYKIWCGMKDRCRNPNSKIYKHYGGRGVSVCSEWKDFAAFRDWAMSNGYEDGLTIDRIDVNGNYEPSNCRWADKFVQMNNMTSNHYYVLDGKKLTMPQIERMLGFPRGLIAQRVQKLGIPLDEAIKYPPHCLPKKST